MTLAVCFAVFVRLPNKLGQDHWSQSFWKRSCFAAFCSLLRSTVHIHVLPPMKYLYYKKQYCFYFCHRYINQFNYFKAGKSLHGWLYVYHTRSGLLLKQPSRFRKIKLILSLIKLYLLLLNFVYEFLKFLGANNEAPSHGQKHGMKIMRWPHWCTAHYNRPFLKL